MHENKSSVLLGTSKLYSLFKIRTAVWHALLDYAQGPEFFIRALWCYRSDVGNCFHSMVYVAGRWSLPFSHTLLTEFGRTTVEHMSWTLPLPTIAFISLVDKSRNQDDGQNCQLRRAIFQRIGHAWRLEDNAEPMVVTRFSTSSACAVEMEMRKGAFLLPPARSRSRLRPVTH